MDGRNHLQPDRLPDAGRAVVPDNVRVGHPVLLAARLAHVERLVLGAHDQDLFFAIIQLAGDVGGKGRVAALMARHQAAVDPDGGHVIDGAKVEHNPLGLLALHRKCAPVPDDGMAAGVVDTAGSGLRRERHLNLAAEDVVAAAGPAVVDPAVFVVVGKPPLTAQVDPIVAEELWIGRQFLCRVIEQTFDLHKHLT